MNLNSSNDTIAAIATAGVNSAIGIIRLSGPAALEILKNLAPGFPEKVRSHQMILTRLIDSENGDLLDEVLAVYMQSPHSYTGEDAVELYCHGGAVHLKTVMDRVIDAGARPAEAGEFTRRAFINGRLDLVQAEAIADLIHARSEAACRQARHYLAGRLSREIIGLRERIGHSLVLTEAAIDFSGEEHVYSLDTEQLVQEQTAVLGEIDHLLSTYDRGRVERGGVRCIIAGRPNVGKSSLLNCLIEEERVIVSAIPGTTRDYVEAEITVEGQLFILVDTAGLRDGDDQIEREGIRRTRALIKESDLIMYVVDQSEPFVVSEHPYLTDYRDKVVLFVNKSDLPAVGALPVIDSLLCGPVAISLTESGSTRIEIERALVAGAKSAGLMGGVEGMVISRARHREALSKASIALGETIQGIQEGLDIELLAFHLREALNAVGEVVGEVTPDDILGKIFSEFCVGK
jgi:tRNA modification GTPase